VTDKKFKTVIENPNNEQWHDSIIKIRQNQSNWKRLYVAPEKD